MLNFFFRPFGGEQLRYCPDNSKSKFNRRTELLTTAFFHDKTMKCKKTKKT